MKLSRTKLTIPRSLVLFFEYFEYWKLISNIRTKSMAKISFKFHKLKTSKLKIYILESEFEYSITNIRFLISISLIVLNNHANGENRIQIRPMMNNIEAFPIILLVLFRFPPFLIVKTEQSSNIFHLKTSPFPELSGGIIIFAVGLRTPEK